MVNEKQTTKSKSIWEKDLGKKKNTFTADDVIKAYLSGKREGLNSHKRDLLNALDKKMIECGRASVNLVKSIKARGYSVGDVYLKIEQFDYFRILILVDEADVVKQDFISVYDDIMEIEDRIYNQFDTIGIMFQIVSYNESTFDYDQVNSDGFIFTLSQNEQEIEACPA